MHAGPLDTETDPSQWEPEELEQPPEEDHGMNVLAELKKHPTFIRRRGNQPWHEALEQKNPKLKKEIDKAIEEFHRGKLPNFGDHVKPFAKALVGILEPHGVKVSPQTMSSYIDKAKANGSH